MGIFRILQGNFEYSWQKIGLHKCILDQQFFWSSLLYFKCLDRDGQLSILWSSSFVCKNATRRNISTHLLPCCAVEVWNSNGDALMIFTIIISQNPKLNFACYKKPLLFVMHSLLLLYLTSFTIAFYAYYMRFHECVWTQTRVWLYLPNIFSTDR